jgi:hypothetical protein
MIGLMGLKADGTLVTPKGKDLFCVSLSIGRIIQNIQHWIAQKTWK